MVNQQKTRGTERFLSLALRGERSETESSELVSLYQGLGDDVCFQEASKNQVLPLVAHVLCDTLPSERLDARWGGALASNACRVECLTEALARVVTRLEDAGCHSAVVENGGIMFGTNLSLSAFCAHDFDLLVESQDFDRVRTIFQSESFQLCDRRRRPTNRAEFCRPGPDGDALWINAGCQPFDRMWVPLAYNDRSAAWLDRRVRSVRHPALWVLCPADALALAAIHTSLHSYVRAPGIRLHVDVDRLVRDAEVDWDLFISEVQALGMPTRAYVSLAMASKLLETPVPDAVLAALYPGKRRWARLESLLAREGSFATRRRKLTPLRTVLLDRLICDRSAFSWISGLLWPSESWMREHFGRHAGKRESVAVLHLKRASAFLRRWQPE